MSSSSGIGGKLEKNFAKRSEWIDRQKPGMKSMLRSMRSYGPGLEDFRPSLKKLMFGSNFDRYSELFKSPNTPDPDSSESGGRA